MLKPEAGAFADFLGGEEGIEDAVGVGDAVAVVAERDFDETVAADAWKFQCAGRCADSRTAS